MAVLVNPLVGYLFYLLEVIQKSTPKSPLKLCYSNQGLSSVRGFVQLHKV